MPRSYANAAADAAASNLNPTGNLAVAGGQVVQLLITYETGRNPDLDGLLGALQTFYGSGKVTGDDDVVSRGIMRLRVAA
jgi:hypothetical protein